MIKRILLTLLSIAAIAYIVVAVMYVNRTESLVCKGIELAIKDSAQSSIITSKELVNMLQKQKLNPVGKKMEEIQVSQIEEFIASHPLMRSVECYKTPSNKILVEIQQRIPVIRVIASNGENYFVGNEAEIIPFNSRCVVDLPVATGVIDKTFAKNELYRFALFLKKNEFWNSQIEQINILSDKTIELVPRVGQHVVYLGTFANYQEKLERLKKFYTKALNQVGWNKYSRINVEFSNQIICTRRE
ncbi:MAG: cell division protein FtsQ [Bacteroidales bacterium]|nr:cell division protein FtsQ [Bacteroidales bacterium]